ncbi:DUF6448 family protein [candidate division KSB1 bacterium]|nr:DUF6448 family protein [candidate division KSB1 bacterium]
MKTKTIFISMAIACAAMSFLLPRTARAHCDAMNGPVVMAAKSALEKGGITPVLKWIKKEYEAETQAAFKKTLMVRNKGPEAKELADMYFFETVVRLHRAGEGEPYTGIKPASAKLEPAVVAADKALESGSVEVLVKMITDDVAKGIRERFEHTIAAKKHAEKSVEAGREFVAAYVEFMHYVERLHHDAASKATHHGESNGVSTTNPHEH